MPFEIKNDDEEEDWDDFEEEEEDWDDIEDEEDWEDF